MNERRRCAPRCGAGAAATASLMGAGVAGRPTGWGRAGPSGTARSDAAARPHDGDRIGGPAVGVDARPAGEEPGPSATPTNGADGASDRRS